MRKVALFLVDGMRSDGMMQCGNPYVKTLMQDGQSTLTGQSVMPTITLPVHMSMFHSVPPERHGITTNTYVPPSHPLDGLAEHLCTAGKQIAFFYDWDPLRNIISPNQLVYAHYASGYRTIGGVMEAGRRNTTRACEYLQEEQPDFFIFYNGTVDAYGHDYGFMSQKYLEAISEAFERIQKISACLGREYTVIVTTDHGGHERTHGTDMKEDMTIPFIGIGEPFLKGKGIEKYNVLDLAPTVSSLLGVAPASGWEGRSLV